MKTYDEIRERLAQLRSEDSSPGTTQNNWIDRQKRRAQIETLMWVLYPEDMGAELAEIRRRVIALGGEKTTTAEAVGLLQRALSRVQDVANLNITGQRPTEQTEDTNE